MKPPATPTEPPAPAHNWRDLRLALNWCYEGVPLGKKISTTGVNLSAWHLLKGEVAVRAGGQEVWAGPGEWLVCRPVERSQNFSDSARILSIHLAVECPLLAAGWSGPGAVVLGDDAELARRAARLQKTAALRPLAHRERRNLIDLPLPLAEALELREAVAAFAGRLLVLLEASGLRFGPPEIRDERVRSSRLQLAAAGLRDGFSRTSLARTHGLSPSQLDRLWREESGLTPRQYWDHRRLEAACVRLQNEAGSIKVLAYDLGFSHLSRFSIWFRGRMRESPRQFRRRFRAE